MVIIHVAILSSRCARPANEISLANAALLLWILMTAMIHRLELQPRVQKETRSSDGGSGRFSRLVVERRNFIGRAPMEETFVDSELLPSAVLRHRIAPA